VQWRSQKSELGGACSDGYEPNKTGAPVGLGVDVGCSQIKIFIIIYALYNTVLIGVIFLENA